jgi:hypothetical protein
MDPNGPIVRQQAAGQEKRVLERPETCECQVARITGVTGSLRHFQDSSRYWAVLMAAFTLVSRSGVI